MRIVTVGRYGARMARVSKVITRPVFTSKVYEARARRRDGVMTWRLVRMFGADATSGLRVTPPMERRAEARADVLGVPFVADIRHGMRVGA